MRLILTGAAVCSQDSVFVDERRGEPFEHWPSQLHCSWGRRPWGCLSGAGTDVGSWGWGGAGGGTLLLLMHFASSSPPASFLARRWPPISWASSALKPGEDAEPFSHHVLGKDVSAGGW